MKNFHKARFPWGLAAVSVIFLLAACASVPKTLEDSLDRALPLDGGAMLYLVVDVPRARPFLDYIDIEGLAKEDAAQILDKTRHAAAAVFPPNSGKRLQAASWGNYPSFGAGLAFTSAKDWKRKRSPAGPFWYSADRDISLAFNKGQAFAALGPAEGGAEITAGTTPAAGPYAQGPGVPVPETFSAFREGACLALWLENPAEPLSRFLEGLRLPIRIPAEEFLASLVPLASPEEASAGFPEGAAGPAGAGTPYEIRLQIRAPSETNARTLMTLFSTARIFLSRAGDAEYPELLYRLLARPPEQEGPYLKLRSAPLNERDIALLFALFSIYSGRD
ncbi:MAG: hypothetical protein LBG07_11940 [Treponema sp.]|nr:hypothetical protein [Treponema sp.]